jgi:transposase
MSATHTTDSTTATIPVLYLDFGLGNTSWKLAFTVGAGQKPRIRTIPARHLDLLMVEIAKAKHRFGLPEEAAVISCYEAGRDGFWLGSGDTIRGFGGHRFRGHHT